jgi:antitoxin (DNA-binding transcriptional repressor) of toxin-antitoxin stability system
MSTPIPDLHARLSGPEALLGARRALCRMAVRLLADGASAGDILRSTDVLDSPLLRHAVHRALAAGGAPLRCDVAGAGALAASPDRVDAAGFSIAVASHPNAARVLAGVLDRLGGGQQRMSVLTGASGPRFSETLDRVRAGVEVALTASPALLHDLLPHVTLIALLDQAAGVQSASLREFPGIVLVAEPRSPLAAAEMLVHEAAHQKFFDLALVHDLLDVHSDACPPFTPPWRDPGTRWPIEQSLAALHTYACLAQLAVDVERVLGPQPVGPGSLLPEAAERVRVIGGWLLAHSAYLAPDARFLVDGLLGLEAQPAPVRTEGRSILDSRRVTVDPSLRIDLDAAPGRVLVARSAQRCEFYFLDPDSGLLLDLLRDMPLPAAVGAFASRRQLQRSDAEQRAGSILPQLAAADLVSIDKTGL